MTDDELALKIMEEEREEFEEQVFELLFGIDARPPKTVEESTEVAPRIFSYEDAAAALREASNSLQLLHLIEEYFSCPQDQCCDDQCCDDHWDEDTEENCEMRELIERLRGKINEDDL